MKKAVRIITWYDDAVDMKGFIEPFQYFRARFNSHNVTGIDYAAHYIRRTKYIGWAMVLNNE